MNFYDARKLLSAETAPAASATGLEGLLRRIEAPRKSLAAHPLYGSLKCVEDVRRFMEYHVYAVWDFMALLKALQRSVTCVGSAWLPASTARIRRLINGMVLEEESDEIDGVATSHFELYCQAMREAGADLGRIDAFLSEIAAGTEVRTALADVNAPVGARAFVGTTFDIIASDLPHAVAAAFAFGREDAIPQMFGPIVAGLDGNTDALTTFLLYLNRHIELDGSEHSAMAAQMLEALCGDDQTRWDEAAAAAERAIAARIALWDAIRAELPALAHEVRQ